MADIFDQVGAAPPSGDIFDQVAGQKPSAALPQPGDVAQEAEQSARVFAEYATRPAPPPQPTIEPFHPSLMQRILAPIREGAIGRAFGISSETAAARQEDPSNPVVRAEAAIPDAGPGVLRGAAEFASGLTTPENLLMMAGTGGLGALEKQLGKGLVTRLASAGFSADMLHNAYQQVPALREAWNKSDWPQVRQQLTKMTLGAGMAGLAAAHAVKGGAATPEKSSEVQSPPEAAAPPAGGDIFDQVAPEAPAATSGDVFDQVQAEEKNDVHQSGPTGSGGEQPQAPQPQQERIGAQIENQEQGQEQPAGGRPGGGAPEGQRVEPEPAAQPVPAVERGPGWVGNIPTSDIKADAPRFQFKANVGQGGAGDELREVTRYDPEKAGIASVWKDPADGQTYIVNGHHRLELAQRTGAPEMTVRYLQAANAQEARTKGALINIAEGRGESTDAAKVFRDSGMSAEELARHGVSIKGKIAKEGMALSKLAQPIFDDVVDGSLTPARGAVIGAGVEGHADQRALYDLIKQREGSGKRLTNDQVEELIRLNNRTSTKTENTADEAQGSMFGAEELTRSLLPEKAEVSDYVRKQLGSEKKLFGVVGTEAAASRLSEGGNVINAAENAQVADRANRGMALYDKLSSSAGPIDGILDRAAQRIANGENANEAKQQAYREIRSHVLAQADRLAGVPPGGAGGTEGHGREGAHPADAVRVPPAAQEVGGPQSSLVTPAEEQQSQAEAKHSADKLLGDQLTAQVASGGPVHDPHLKPAENRGLFDEPQPETGDLFSLFGGEPADRTPEPPAPAAPSRTLDQTFDPKRPESILDSLAAQRKLGDVFLPRAKREAGADALAMAQRIEESRGKPYSSEAILEGQRAILRDHLRQHFPELAGGNGERGAISPELLTLGAEKFWQDDVAPALHEAAKTVVGSADDILKVLAPQLRSSAAYRGGLVLRNRLSEMARRYDRAEAALRTAKRAFDRMEPKDNYAFIDRIEQGQDQPAPELQHIADVLRAMLDGRRADVQALGSGKLRKYYENYFPHIWKDGKKAGEVFASFFGRRPLEGGKSFLKKRTLPTFDDGLKAGLKPVSNNPIDLVMLKVREMDRFIMAHQVLADWKKGGLAKFVDAREGKAPAGWRKIDDPIGAVYGQSIQHIPEYPNAGLWSGLHDVASALGLRHERGFTNLRGAVGRAHMGTGRIETMHGSAEQVLAHEIGHHIDLLAGSGRRFVLEYPDAATVQRLKQARATLRDMTGTTLDQRRAARQELDALKPAIAQRKQFAQELRNLADLRSGRKEYTHSREEKMAQLAEMWVGAREQFARTAPTVYREWQDFLNQNPKLHALRDIEGGAEVTQLAQPYDVGGLVVKGHYWAPEGAARILNNHLSPGLRNRSGAYRVLLGANNVLNQFQLGLGAFHLGFTSVDAAVSKGAIALEQLASGRPASALRSAAQVPFAPLTTLLQGNKVLREWYQPGSQGAPIAGIVDALEKGGGRARMDEFYATHIGENMMRAFRSGNILGGLIRAPFAAGEALSDITMKHIVPRQKLGVFADLARLEMERLGPGATVEQTRAAMGKAWDSVENRMGQMTYDNLFWDRTAKDLAMLGVRSVGWNLGTVREIGGAGVDAARAAKGMATGKGVAGVNPHRVAYVASLALTSAAMGAMYQYLATGKGPQELKDYYFPKTGELDEAGRPQRASLPTYVKDIYHYSTEPVKTVEGKISPLLSTFADMIRNEDFYGTRIRNEDDPLIQQMKDEAEYAAKQFTPFSARNVQREADLGAPMAQRAQQFVGITPAPAALEQTPAERLAHELGAAHMPQGGRTAAEADRARLRNDLTRSLGAGKGIPPNVREALSQRKLTAKDLTEARRAAHQKPLARSFTHLGLDDAMRVYRTANGDERKGLRPLLLSKAKSALPGLPAAQRAATMERLRDLFASK